MSSSELHAGPHPGALVHEKNGGGRTMHVSSITDTRFTRLAHCEWRDEQNDLVRGTFVASELVVVVPARAAGDR